MKSLSNKKDAILDLLLNIEKRMTNLENRFNKFLEILGYKVK